MAYKKTWTINSKFNFFNEMERFKNTAILIANFMTQHKISNVKIVYNYKRNDIAFSMDVSHLYYQIGTCRRIITGDNTPSFMEGTLMYYDINTIEENLDVCMNKIGQMDTIKICGLTTCGVMVK